MNSNWCPSSGQGATSCFLSDPNLPKNFCCVSGETCISLDNSSSAYCCPNGVDCGHVPTISCNISLQNANLTTSNVYTTNLNGTLPTCNGQCCPFGYECEGSDCRLANANSQAVPTSNVSGPSSTPSAIYSHGNSNTTSSTLKIALGVAIPVFVIMTIAFGWFILRRRRQNRTQQYSSLRTSVRTTTTARSSIFPWTEKPQLELQIPSSTWTLAKEEITRSLVAPTVLSSPTYATVHQLERPRLLEPLNGSNNNSVYELE